MTNKKFLFLLAGAAMVLLSGCNLQAIGQSTPTQDENLIITMAAETSFAKLTQVGLLASDTPGPTPTTTPLPPSVTPIPVVLVTPVAMDGLGLENATVYSLPGNDGISYGTDSIQSRRVKVWARNITGQWLLINFNNSPSGTGWVSSSSIKLSGDIGRLDIGLLNEENQIVFIAPLTWTISGVPLSLPTLSTDPSLRSATTVKPANVRVCPNLSCMMIGVINVGQQLTLTGRVDGNKWAQFLYPSGPNAKGWVSRDSIQPSGNGFGGLPYFDELGRLLTPEPPTATIDPNISPTPSKTLLPTPAGPLAEITATTTVYSLQNSLSQVLGTLNPKDRIIIVAQSYNRLWFEIQYPADSTGRGFISTKSVYMLGDLTGVPLTDVNGTPYPTP